MCLNTDFFSFLIVTVVTNLMINDGQNVLTCTVRSTVFHSWCYWKCVVLRVRFSLLHRVQWHVINQYMLLLRRKHRMKYNDFGRYRNICSELWLTLAQEMKRCISWWTGVICIHPARSCDKCIIVISSRLKRNLSFQLMIKDEVTNKIVLKRFLT